MQIIKPYGRSHVAGADAKDKPGRMLRQTESPATSRDIADFAHVHDPLVIAQWISAIDKIATKPKGNKGPTAAQKDLRTVLGNAAWQHISAHGLLPGAKDATEKQKLHLIWQSKIAPWGNARQIPEDKGRPSPKGRWYDRFVGDVAPADITPDHARRIATEIHDHLYVAARRRDPEKPNRRLGLIEGRAQTIAKNVLKPGDHAAIFWNADDRERYSQAGDVAGQIYAAAKREIDARNNRTPNRRPTVQKLPRDLAAKILYDQYARVFGQGVAIKDAQAKAPALFALHAAIKDCYRRIIKDYRKQDILRILPCDMPSLFNLIEAQHRNRDINALIRLGKVIHYHAGENGPGTTRDIIDNWPSKADVETSRFWGSDGQADIKRHEAFVRVWRHVIALASRTLHDWVDPEGRFIKGDIFKSTQQATGRKIFDSNRYRQKLAVLFGGRAETFYGDPVFEKFVLAQAITRTANLRHATFHFKGKDRFVQEMHSLAGDLPQTVLDSIATPLPGNIGPDVKDAIAALWQNDMEGRDAQIVATLRGIYADHFLSLGQNRQIYDALTAPDARSGRVPLPRLNRVLLRHDNAREDKERLPLPMCPNRAELEKHLSSLCQYSILKMLYDGPFRHWLEQRSSDELNRYIDRAIDRTTRAAKTINGKKRPKAEEVLIISRADDLPRLAPNEKIASFLSRLSAATATEMRVQRGYDSNADKAREQAEFIGDLECDVMALALVDFIGQGGFDYVLALNPQTPKPETPQCDITAFPDQARPSSSPESPAVDWQQVLYFILHLVPVDEAGRLLHQIRKWQILETKAGQTKPDQTGADQTGENDIAGDLQAVLTLYLDMHDAKFTGGDALHGVAEFAGFFEHPADFRAVFPPQTPQDHDRSIPRRGLREIMRFGHLPLLQRLSGDVRITHANVTDWQTARTADGTGTSPVSQMQDDREKLHEKAVRETQSFGDEDVRAYAAALRGVITHRHLSAHVTLSDLVRLHRLMMGVLGRLVDFAGLWERDIYFIVIALLYRHAQSPRKVFTPDQPGGPGKKDEEGGLSLLQDGRIVEALRNIREDVPDTFREDFNRTCPLDAAETRIRNMLSHFNMLRTAQTPDLTDCINQTRHLMRYDRKLKNAVSRSVREMLAREGLDIKWQMEKSDGQHQLCKARLSPRQAKHFQNPKIKLRDMSRNRPEGAKFIITENMHSSPFVKKAAILFGVNPEDLPKDKDLHDITSRRDFGDLCRDKNGSGQNRGYTPNGQSKTGQNRNRSQKKRR